MKIAISNKYGLQLPVFVLGLLFLLLNCNFGFNSYDEGVSLLNAVRILNGDVPYRDFWTIYSPGTFYLNAVLLSIFDSSILGVRIFWLAMIYVLSILLFLIAKKVSNSPNALIPFIVSIIFFGAIPQNARAIIPALLLFSLSVYFLILFEDSKKTKHLVYAGFAGAFVFLFRYEFGIYLLAASAFYIFFLFVNKRNEAAFSKYLIFFIILLFSFAVFLSLLFLYIPMSDIYEQFIKLPFSIFPNYRSLPAPLPFKSIYVDSGVLSMQRNLLTIWEFVVFYLPLVLSVIGIYLYLTKRKQKNVKTSIIFIILTTLSLFGQASVRSDVEHAMPSLVLSVVLLSYFLSVSERKFTKAVIIITILFTVSFPIIKKYQAFEAASLGKTEYYSIKSAYGISSGVAWKNSVESTFRFIQNNVPQNECIFVGNTKHSNLIANNVILYFLTERKPCSKYHELHPGVATRADIQQNIISDIRTKKVRFIVLYDEDYRQEPNMSSYEKGSDLLDSSIAVNFHAIKKFGSFSIYQINK